MMHSCGVSQTPKDVYACEERWNLELFYQSQHGYYATGGKVAKAWDASSELMKK